MGTKKQENKRLEHQPKKAVQKHELKLNEDNLLITVLLCHLETFQVFHYTEMFLRFSGLVLVDFETAVEHPERQTKKTCVGGVNEVYSGTSTFFMQL